MLQSQSRIIKSCENCSPIARFIKSLAGHRPTMNGRSRTEVTFAILFSALSSPCVAQGSHNDFGGSQNQPPSDSISMLMSVFLVISVIAVSNALWPRFAQTRITVKAEEASDRALSTAILYEPSLFWASLMGLRWQRLVSHFLALSVLCWPLSPLQLFCRYRCKRSE